MNINPMTFPAYFNNPLLRMTLCAHMGNLCIHGLKKKKVLTFSLLHKVKKSLRKEILSSRHWKISAVSEITA